MTQLTANLQHTSQVTSFVEMIKDLYYNCQRNSVEREHLFFPKS